MLPGFTIMGKNLRKKCEEFHQYGICCKFWMTHLILPRENDIQWMDHARGLPNGIMVTTIAIAEILIFEIISG